MITVTRLKKTCESCPSQWEGYTTDDRQIYVRYRWGFLSVSVGDPGDDSKFAGVRGKDIFARQVNADRYCGFLLYDELKELTEGIVKWP